MSASAHCRTRSWRAAAASCALAASLLAPPAAAEIGASLSVASDYRYRGRSLSGGRAVATLDLAYDDAGGTYAGVSATGVATPAGARLLGVAQYAGYSMRTRSGPVLDFGVINRTYTRFYARGQADNDFEAYVGVIGRNVTSRLYLAPDYYGRGATAVYAEVEGAIALAGRTRLNGHVGVLTPLEGELYPNVGRAQYDWRLGLSQRAGGFGVAVAVTGVGPSPDFYRRRPRPRNAIVLSISRAF